MIFSDSVAYTKVVIKIETFRVFLIFFLRFQSRAWQDSFEHLEIKNNKSYWIPYENQT